MCGGNSAELTELVNGSGRMNECMDDEGMLVGNKEGRKEGRRKA